MTTDVVQPLTRKGAATRSRLVQAAKFVFERNGFLNARVSDIATRAKISYGSFSHDFDSKEAVFLEVARLEEAGLTSPSCGGGAGEGDVAPTAMEHITEANRRYLERYREQAPIMGVIEELSLRCANALRIPTGADHLEPEVHS
jgi:AcrR family transcriptional regulator